MCSNPEIAIIHYLSHEKKKRFAWRGMSDKNGSSNYDANNNTNNSQANGEKQARKEKL